MANDVVDNEISRRFRMEKIRTALVISRFRNRLPDTLILQNLERNCLACSSWESFRGPVLFLPTKISTRFFTALHMICRPFLRKIKRRDVVLGLGMPYRHYLLGKTFPHFAFDTPLRVLWTYDVWEPRFADVAALVQEARIGLLLLTTLQATEHFRSLNLPNCVVHWVPEVVEVGEYPSRPWAERTIDIIAFGRGHPRYHTAIAAECEVRGLRYVYQRFDTADDLVQAMGNSKISICFPQSMTHPERVGRVSTVTLRYLESMAAKCLVLGGSPLEAKQMFGYNPVIEADWDNPVGQLLRILQNPDGFFALIEKNYAAVAANHQTRNLVASIDALIAARLEGQRQ